MDGPPQGSARQAQEVSTLAFPTRPKFLALVLVAAAGALGGCVAGTEMSYSRYEYDPYSGTERVYERNVSASPSEGVRTETCRTTIRRRLDPFGGEFERGVEVCDETPQGYAGQPLSPDDVPQSVYRGPAQPPLPTAALPDPG
jgi:hypothetical protein